MRLRAALVTLFVSGACFAAMGLENEYALDRLDRSVPAEGLDCATLEQSLVTHQGTNLQYRPPARVHPAFRDRLVRFEAMLKTLSNETYGRPPRAIRNGTFRCRPMKRNAGRISEHALGNALDVVAFEFGPVARAAPATLPTKLRRAFTVRVDRHWSATGEEAIHSCFLQTLAARVRGRSDVFRGLIGPADPDHRDHLHFDTGPWRFDRLGITQRTP